MTNKAPNTKVLIRVKRIVKLLGLLQGGKGHNARDLALACGVSRRTIFRDLDSLRRVEVPLVFEDDKKKADVHPGAILPAADDIGYGDQVEVFAPHALREMIL